MTARARSKPRKSKAKAAPKKKRSAKRARPVATATASRDTVVDVTAPVNIDNTAAAESGAQPAQGEWLTEKLRELTPKQERFCQEYLVDLNGAGAAVRAGYSEATAKQIAYETIHLPQVQERLAALMNARAVRTRISKDRVLTGIAEMAHYDIADAFDEKGAVKAVHDMPPALRNAIAGIEVNELSIEGVVIGHVKKIKLVDRARAHEMLGRHLKLFTDKLEINDKTGLAERIKRARARKAS